MTTRFVFSGSEELETALRSGLVPPRGAGRPAFVRPAAAGLVIETDATLDDEAGQQLESADVEVSAKRGKAAGGRPLICWSEAVPPASTPIGQPGTVLFVRWRGEGGDGASPLEMITELM